MEKNLKKHIHTLELGLCLSFFPYSLTKNQVPGHLISTKETKWAFPTLNLQSATVTTPI